MTGVKTGEKHYLVFFGSVYVSNCKTLKFTASLLMRRHRLEAVKEYA